MRGLLSRCHSEHVKDFLEERFIKANDQKLNGTFRVPESFEVYEVHTKRTPFWKYRSGPDPIRIVSNGEMLFAIDGWPAKVTFGNAGPILTIEVIATQRGECEDCRIVDVANGKEMATIELTGLHRFHVRGTEWFTLEPYFGHFLVADEDGNLIGCSKPVYGEKNQESPIDNVICLEPSQPEFQKIGAMLAICCSKYGFRP